MKSFILNLQKLVKHDDEKLFFGSMFLFLLTFVFYFPAKILSGNTLEILVSDETFFTGLALVVVTSFLLYIPYKLLYLVKRTRPILRFVSYGFYYWTASCIFYGLFRVDILARFGKLQGVSFENFKITSQEIWISLILYFAFFIAFLLIAKKIKTKHLIASLLLASFTFLVEGVYLNRTQISSKSKGKHYVVSQNNPNTIIFVLDMFQGDILPQVFENYPEVKPELDGFTWYPYAQAVGEGTVANIYKMVSGKKYNLQYLNSLAQQNPKLRVADLTAEVMSNSFLKRYHDDGAKVFLLADYTFPFVPEKMDFLSSYSGGVSLNHNFLLNLSLLRGMPLFLKPYIYRNSKGRWRVGDIYLRHGQFDDIMESVVIQDNYPPTLNMFHTNETHGPYTKAQNCQRSLRLAHQNSQSPEEERERASYTYGCAMKIVTNFLQKLKESGAYDRTRIVIMSDHGASSTGEANIHHLEDYQVKIDGRWNPLILIKDFNQKGELQISPSLMLTIDLPAWVCDDLCPEIDAVDNRDGHLQQRTFKADHAAWEVDWFKDRFFKNVPESYEERIFTYEKLKFE